MQASIVAGALFAAFALSASLAVSVAVAGESDRTYPKAACTDRNANAADCVIQDGPPRRNAFGPNTPPVQQPSPGPRPNVPSGQGGGVSVLGAGK
jgi:hypothetical protein